MASEQEMRDVMARVMESKSSTLDAETLKLIELITPNIIVPLMCAAYDEGYGDGREGP